MNVGETRLPFDIASHERGERGAAAAAASSPFVLPEAEAPAQDRPVRQRREMQADRADARPQRTREDSVEGSSRAREQDATARSSADDGDAGRASSDPRAPADAGRGSSGHARGDDAHRKSPRHPGNDGAESTHAASTGSVGDARSDTDATDTAGAAEALPETMLALLGAAAPAARTTPAAGAVSASAPNASASGAPMLASTPRAALQSATDPSALLSAAQATPVVAPAGTASTPAAVPDGFAALVAMSGAAPKSSGLPGDAALIDAVLAPSAERAQEPGAASPTSPLFAAAAVGRPADMPSSATVPVAGTVPLPATPDDGFDDAFGQRIVWMVEHRITQAEMRVSPEGVGAIDVRLQLEGNRLTAQFSAASADVRQALEAGMGRLRDMLGQHGMELGDSHVGQQNQGDRPGTQTGRMHGAEGETGSEPVTTIRALRTRGLLDVYA